MTNNLVMNDPDPLLGSWSDQPAIPSFRYFALPICSW
jgi:hypothetical protein